MLAIVYSDTIPHSGPLLKHEAEWVPAKWGCETSGQHRWLRWRHKKRESKTKNYNCFVSCIDNEDYKSSDYRTMVEASHPPLFETHYREPLCVSVKSLTQVAPIYVFILKEQIHAHTKTTDGQQAINSLTLHTSWCIHNVSGLGVHDTVRLCCLIKCNQNKSIVF